ncbi:glycosyl transferase [Devosia pacifica]|uniref:Glycosyl transferase n=1 Tax=Devosia pacifica TaxID=1335967 RepID=A0A918VV98_9HYPH|nr:glycosyltransferase family 4 protein [Devosia pacifica]GHA32640.1 glycosyl transferase [Devosia pacifica]
MQTALLACGLALLVSIASVLLVRRHAVALKMIASVNERSSHKAPTPTGGGVGIAAGSLCGWGILWAIGFQQAAVLCVACGALAVLGFMDDRSPLSARLRLVIQFGACALVAAMLVPAIPTEVFGSLSLLIVLAAALPVLLWWVNLFNFMDGIDGLAASQALFMAGGAMILAWLQVPEAYAQPLFFGFAVIALSTLGFLLFNWPPATIFMGDAGSLFLALGLAALALCALAAEWLSLGQCLALASVFVIDASVTLARRLLRGHSPAAAHRSHFYQRLSRRWGGARPVTLTATAINVGIVLPCAYAVGQFESVGLWLVALLYGTGIAIAILGGAGQDENG